LILVMAMTFRWSDNRVAAYLQAEGERLSAAEVRAKLTTAYQQLEAALPDDIREIYLDQTPLMAATSQTDADDLEALLATPDLVGAVARGEQPQPQ
jgi:hypothetical protein